jgi:hypothetical protein
LKCQWGFDRPADDLEGFVERHSASLRSLDWNIRGQGNRIIPIPSGHNALKLHHLCVSDVQQIFDAAHFSAVRALSLRMVSKTLFRVEFEWISKGFTLLAAMKRRELAVLQ